MYFNIQQEVTKKLYFDKGINLYIEDDKEFMYEIEYPKSSWRTTNRSSTGKFDLIIHEYDNEELLVPHSLLFTDKTTRNMINICTGEKDLLKVDSTAISLDNGNLLKTKEIKNVSSAKFEVTSVNNIGCNRIIPSHELMESDWLLVDKQLVLDFGLQPKQCPVIWFLLDSFVIKTDTTRTSSIILGELFDIGLRFMDCMSKYRNVHDLTVVTDMIRIMRIDRKNDYSLEIRKGRDYLSHRVYLSKTAVAIMKDYLKSFPEVVKYITRNLKKFSDRQKVPRDHRVQHLYPELSKHKQGKRGHQTGEVEEEVAEGAGEDTDKTEKDKIAESQDPNIKLFRIYTWIMQQPTSSLKLTSALCLNASSENIKKLDTKIQATLEKFKNKKGLVGKTIPIDKNMVMFNNQDQQVVGTTFKEHPQYPSIGDRVVFVSKDHMHFRFGMTGTIIGTYKLNIEVLFDEPSIGCTDLSGRCPPFRGGICKFLEIFDLTTWRSNINRRGELEDKTAKFGRNFTDYLQEWDGNIDIMLLIRRMNKFKKEHEGHFKHKHQNIGNPHNHKGGYKGGSKGGSKKGGYKKKSLKGNSKPFVNPYNAQNQLQNHSHSKKDQASNLFSKLGPAPENNKGGNGGGYSNYYQANHQNNNGGQNNDDDDEEFVQNFTLTGGQAQNGKKKQNPRRKRNNNGKK